MEIGMFWYDDDKQRTLEEKVIRAAEFYRVKYGVQPTECYVHPSMLAPTIPEQTFRLSELRVPGVKIKMNGTVLKHHLWLGVGDEPAPKPVIRNGAVVPSVKPT